MFSLQRLHLHHPSIIPQSHLHHPSIIPQSHLHHPSIIPPLLTSLIFSSGTGQCWITDGNQVCRQVCHLCVLMFYKKVLIHKMSTNKINVKLIHFPPSTSIITHTHTLRFTPSINWFPQLLLRWNIKCSSLHTVIDFCVTDSWQLLCVCITVCVCTYGDVLISLLHLSLIIRMISDLDDAWHSRSFTNQPVWGRWQVCLPGSKTEATYLL